jgi:hypothetical protein
MTDRPLPHILAPYPNESLFSFGIRLMRANRLPAGALPQVAGRYASKEWPERPAALASGTSFDLGRVATLSGNNLAAIEALTFGPMLRRVYGTQRPSIRALGVVRFQLCVACWTGERELHRLSHFLPGAFACDRHLIALSGACGCAAPLSPSPESVGRCPTCGKRWSSFVARELTATERDLQRRLEIAYAQAFGVDAGSGTRGFGEMLQRLRSRQGKTSAALPLYLSSVSIERMVSIFLALGGDAELVAELRAPTPTACPNAACPRFDLDACTGVIERHCPACGTRFVGARILSTFDLDHGRPRPSRTQVRRAQRRLGRWRHDLRLACADLAASGEPITIERAFAAAGVPLNANLRSPRRGLTAFVRQAEARRSGRETEGLGLPGLVRKKVFSHDVAWLSSFARSHRVRRGIPEPVFRPLRPPEMTREQWARFVSDYLARKEPATQRSRTIVCSLPLEDREAGQ